MCVCAQTPFSKHFPIFMLFGGLTWACSYLNNRNFKPVESMSAEYKAAEAKNIIVSCCCCWQQQLTGCQQQLSAAADLHRHTDIPSQ